MHDDIKALQAELVLLKCQFSERVDTVERRLNNLLVQETACQTDNQQSHHVSKESQVENVKTSSVISTGTVKTVAINQSADTVIPAQPSFFSAFMQTILFYLFDWLAPVVKVYQSYKEKGMLGIFLLTIVGIVLTFAGFGYLMQLLIDQIAVGYKVLLMGFVAMSVVGLGVWLKIKTRFAEFSSAIVALGILLSYSTLYFSGSVYNILPSVVVLSLSLVIALVCHMLALWLETKVIAALGITGIAILPILSDVVNIDDPFYYLLSLACVITSSLVLAYRHLGQWLAQLSFVFTIIVVEWLIGIENVQISAWTVELFYGLFFAYCGISLLSKKVLTYQMLLLLAGVVGASLLVFLQISAVLSSQLTLIFTINTVFAIGLAICSYKITRELTQFFVLLSGLWTVLAIISLVSGAYWGLAWAVEGLLILVIGRQYTMKAVVNQGQILIAIALIYALLAIARYFPLPALQSIDGWLLSISIVAIIGIWQRIINTSALFNGVTRDKIKPFLQQLEVVWLTILVIASANIWLENWAGSCIVVWQLALLFRAKKCKQVNIEVFAALLILVPLFYLFKGALMVDSYRFTLLPLFAKFAIISAFAQLWLWSAFYRRYQANSRLKALSEAARILFYMILPVCWLGSLVRYFDRESMVLLWLSPLLALLLARQIKHSLLLLETKILTALSCVFVLVCFGFYSSFYNNFTLMNFTGLVGFSGFVGFFVLAYLFNRKDPMPIYQYIMSWGVFFVGIAIASMIGFTTDKALYGVIAAEIYWAGAFYGMSRSAQLKRNELLITVMNILLVCSAWLLMYLSVYYIWVAIIFLAILVYQKHEQCQTTLLAKKLNGHDDIFWHTVAAITYSIFFSLLTEYRLDLLIAPALAVHGAMILILTDKQITKVKFSFSLILLAIIKLALIDASNALLWQKVMLFIGIGVFILVASFWYQRLMSKVAA